VARRRGERFLGVSRAIYRPVGKPARALPAHSPRFPARPASAILSPMTKDQWNAFTSFRDDFRAKCAEWARDAGALPDRAATESAVGDAAARGWLAELQKGAAEADHNPAYPLETPVVYNQALDSIAETDDIRLLVIGDNPGKDEQLLKNRRYLVGQAGKLGAGFFRANLELEVDFRKNAVILNKTPIHTAKTKQLAWIRRYGGKDFENLFAASQRWMAERTLRLARDLSCEIWLVGYGELREKGLFAEYAAALKSAAQECATRTTVKYPGAPAGQAVAPVAPGGREPESARDAPAIFPKILLFQHFSMNRFSIDLKERYNPTNSLRDNLDRIGLFHRREILGW